MEHTITQEHSLWRVAYTDRFGKNHSELFPTEKDANAYVLDLKYRQPHHKRTIVIPDTREGAEPGDVRRIKIEVNSTHEKNKELRKQLGDIAPILFAHNVDVYMSTGYPFAAIQLSNGEVWRKWKGRWTPFTWDYKKIVITGEIYTHNKRGEYHPILGELIDMGVRLTPECYEYIETLTKTPRLTTGRSLTIEERANEQVGRGTGDTVEQCYDSILSNPKTSDVRYAERMVDTTRHLEARKNMARLTGGSAVIDHRRDCNTLVFAINHKTTNLKVKKELHRQGDSYYVYILAMSVVRYLDGYGTEKVQYTKILENTYNVTPQVAERITPEAKKHIFQPV